MDDDRISKKHVLLVTNSTTDEEVTLIRDALMTARENGVSIQVSLVHVIPTLPTCYFNIPSMAFLAERYYIDAKKVLASAGKILNVTSTHQWLIAGRMKAEVLKLANKLQTQFILASSTNISDLRSSFFRRSPQATLIRNINHIQG